MYWTDFTGIVNLYRCNPTKSIIHLQHNTETQPHKQFLCFIIQMDTDGHINNTNGYYVTSCKFIGPNLYIHFPDQCMADIKNVKKNRLTNIHS